MEYMAPAKESRQSLDASKEIDPSLKPLERNAVMWAT